MTGIGSYRLKLNQSARIFHRQAAQQDLVEQAVDGCVRSDTQGQDQHGDKGESRALAQLAQRVPKVLQQGAHRLFLSQRFHRVEL